MSDIDRMNEIIQLEKDVETQATETFQDFQTGVDEMQAIEDTIVILTLAQLTDNQKKMARAIKLMMKMVYRLFRWVTK